MQCHASPIYTLARNPSFCKNFLTVGDWNARIWSEDCKESSIIWTKYCSVDLTDGCWSPTKCSLFYLSRIDGNLEAWDLLQQQSEPILTMKVCIFSLYALFLIILKTHIYRKLSFIITQKRLSKRKRHDERRKWKYSTLNIISQSFCYYKRFHFCHFSHSFLFSSDFRSFHKVCETP